MLELKITNPDDLRARHFVWRGLNYHLGRRTKPVLTLVQDATHPHLYRIRYPDGWTSSPANISRAKDAAYGHARHLLMSVGVPSSPHSLVTTSGDQGDGLTMGRPRQGVGVGDAVKGTGAVGDMGWNR